MFKRHYQKRSTNIFYVIFRLCLSMVIFAFLLGGIYSAYKYFTGIDPLKLDPQSLISTLIKTKSPQELIVKIKGIQPPPGTPAPKQAPISFSFVIVADSHNENNYLQKALSQAGQKGELKFIIGMGDYTEVGTVDELRLVKQELDATSLRYFLTPGDHDLWDSRDKNLPANTNFNTVFGPTYQSFVFNNIRFLLLNNADNYLGVDEAQTGWLQAEIEKAGQEGNMAIYAFMHEPLFHPSSDHVMGAGDDQLKAQAKNLVRILRDGGVKEVFFGHNHFFSRYFEPESNLSMTVIGALTTQSNAQVSRYAVVNVFEDGTLAVEDVEVK